MSVATRLQNDQRLDTGDPVREVVVERFCIGAVVRASVAVWTDARDVSRMVRAAVAQPSNMVGLQVRSTSRRGERRRRSAGFANARRSSQDVGANCTATLIKGLNRRAGDGARRRGSVRLLPQDRKRLAGGLIDHIVPLGLLDGLNRNQVEHNRLPKRAGRVSLLLIRPARAHEQANKPNGLPAPDGLENQQVFTVACMVQDRKISADERHISDLPFAGVSHRAVRQELIAVAYRLCAVSGEDENSGRTGWRSNPALLLTAVGPVNIGSAIVEAVRDEGPRHPAKVSGASDSHKALER